LYGAGVGDDVYVCMLMMQTTVMSQSVDDTRIQAQVVHCLGSWLGAYAIPQAYLVSSNLLCIPFSAMVSVCMSISTREAVAI